ncbi:MAG: TRAP transporter substrate-binding protein [Proteobacteria bacterium]|nr:TRAP transporter substrate-binding protein [Pseudomonadota bacterium]
MNTTMRHMLAGGAVAVALALGGSASAQTIVMKLGTVDAEKSHSGVGSEAFAREVEQLSKGTMKVEVFHAGKLGGIPAQIANVFSGSQDMHLLYPEFLSNFAPEAKLISLPYLFDNLEHLQRFYKSELWKPAIDKLDSQGAVLLDKDWTWMIRDPRGLISVKPVFAPDDMKGFKLRIWEDKSAIETWRGFGAITTVVPRPEMYLAFKQGIIQGGPETIGIAYDQKNVEVAKYWTRTEEYYQIINVMINKRKYESLTPDQRMILATAAKNAAKVFVQETLNGYADKKEKARTEFGVTAIEPPLAPWREKGAATVARLLAENYVPATLIEKVRALK